MKSEKDKVEGAVGETSVQGLCRAQGHRFETGLKSILL